MREPALLHGGAVACLYVVLGAVLLALLTDDWEWAAVALAALLAAFAFAVNVEDR